MKLDPHQVSAIPWLLERPKSMLAWEMGTGKTAPLVRAWEKIAHEGPLLVMCLASARENWRREVLMNATKSPVIKAIYNDLAKVDKADVVICNYDKLLNTHIIGQLRSREWGAIVLDEAHALKTPGAKRTRAIYGPVPKYSTKNPVINSGKRVWLATGTPMPNHPGELYSHASTLWPERMQYQGHMMEQWEFEAAFCKIENTVYGPQVVGGRNLGELKERLGPVVSVLKRKDVLTLPPCIITSWPLETDISGGGAPIPDLPGLMATLVKAYGPLDQIDRLSKDDLDVYLSMIAMNAEHLATIRREISVLKAVRVGLTVAEELECGAPKTVIFAHHREAIYILLKTLSKFNPAVIHGDVPGGKRQAEIDRFQTDPRCHVFIGQITAAGSSINLQAAQHVVFVEASWCPGENEQALSRVYRRGQENKVWVRFGYLSGTIDEAVQRVNARKAAMIQKVF